MIRWQSQVGDDLNIQSLASGLSDALYDEASKEGLTADELSKDEPDEPQHMQMTDTRCERRAERKVGVRDIIRAGQFDRYMLECMECGYASRDAVSMLTLDASDSKGYVGTDPRATVEFENVEEKLPTSRETDKMSNGIFMPPPSESHKSFGKSRKDEDVGSFTTC